MKQHDFIPTDWMTITPLLERLLEKSITEHNLALWLEEWNQLDIALYDAWTSLKHHGYTHISDASAEKTYQAYSKEMFSTYQEYTVKLAKKALAVSPESPNGKMQAQWQRWRALNQRFKPESLPCHQRISDLEGKYRELSWNIDAQDGRSVSNWYSYRDELNVLMLALIETRQKLAQVSEYSSFLHYRWQELNRFGYTVESHQVFHDSVEKHVVPMLKKIHLSDIQLTEARTVDDEAGLLHAIEIVLEKIDMACASLFHKMQPEHVDVGQRPEKVNSLEDWFFPAEGMPHLHVSSGAPAPILHEFGHGFHEFVSFKEQGSLWNFAGPDEFQEIAALSMEMFAWPHYQAAFAGLLSPQEIKAAHQKDIYFILNLIAFASLNDSFEHWVYGEHEESITTDALDQKWLELKQRFTPWDLVGQSEEEALSGWQRGNWSLYRMPLYAISYAIAIVGEGLLGIQAAQDRLGTIEQYKEVLAAGNTKNLPDLFGDMGITFPFTEEAIQKAVRFFLAELE